MIEFSRRTHSRKHLDLTPLIDVVFQLLVFFILASVFEDPGVPLNLPQSSTSEPQEANTVVISIDADDSVHIGSELIPIEQLGAVLQQHKRDMETPRIALRGDAASRYGAFMQVVDACREQGINNVVLMTGSKGEE